MSGKKKTNADDDNDEEYSIHSASSPISIVRLVNKGMTVILSFYSSFIVNLIIQAGHPLEFTLIVVAFFLVWISIESWLKKSLNSIYSLQKNTQWKEVLFDVIDNISLLSIFIFVQIIFAHLSNPISSPNLSVAEKITSLMVIYLLGFSLLQTIKSLNS